MPQLLEIPKSAFASSAATDELFESGLAADARLAALSDASHGVVVQVGHEIPRCFGVSGSELTEFASIPVSLVIKETTTVEQISKSLASELQMRDTQDPGTEASLNIWSFSGNPADTAFDIWTDDLRPILSLSFSDGLLSWFVETHDEVLAHPISPEEAEGLIAVSLQSLFLPATQPTTPLQTQPDQVPPVENETVAFLNRFDLAQMAFEQEHGPNSQTAKTLFSPAVVVKVSVTSEQMMDTTYFSINGDQLAIWVPQQDGVALEYLLASEASAKVYETLERCLGAAMSADVVEPGEFALESDSEDPTRSPNAPQKVQAADPRDQLQFSVEAVRMDADMMIRGVAFSGFAGPEIGLWEVGEKSLESRSGRVGVARQLAGSELKTSIQAVLSSSE